MFSEREYTVYCHVCKKLHTIRASFLSSEMYRHDGKSYPGVCCAHHSADEIRASWIARHTALRNELALKFGL
jgi:hypothetical protein